MIRSFQTSDIGQVMEIWRSGNEQAHPFIPKSYWSAHIPAVRQAIAQAEVYVYETGGSIQGFLGLIDDYIAGIFVDQTYRSLGIGTKLLDFVKSGRSALSLNVYQKNTRAVSFYLRAGFSVRSEGWDEAVGERDYTMVWQAAAGAEQPPAPPSGSGRSAVRETPGTGKKPEPSAPA